MAETKMIRYDRDQDATFRPRDDGTWEMTSRGTRTRPLEIYQPADVPALPPSTAMQESRVAGTYRDRAEGFQVATVPIAVAFGVGVAIVAIVGFGTPVFSISALTVFWLAFLAWWLAGWLIHNLLSPDGVAFLHTILGWRYIYREQRERMRRYDQ